MTDCIYGENNTYSTSTLKTEENNIYNALPSSIKPAFKQFKVKTAENGMSSTVIEYDVYMCSPAEKEVFGSRTYSVEAEANALTQFDYFKTANNRIKQFNGTNKSWWERSPWPGNALNACYVNGSDPAYHNGTNIAMYVSPFGCI